MFGLQNVRRDKDKEVYESAFLCENTLAHTFAHCERNKLQQTECQSYQEKWITSKLSRLCITIKNDRIWLLWNNGGNSFEMRRIWEISFTIQSRRMGRSQLWA